MSIACIAIIDQQDKLSFIDYYINNEDQVHFKFQTYTALQLISPALQKKLNGGTSTEPYLGVLYTIYLPNNDYDVHAYITITQLKMIIFIKQGTEKLNLLAIFEKIYGLYRASNFNPFHQTNLNKLIKPMVVEFNGI
ncbi:unnamed protein product [Paramecium primaurelia]|uniref:Trafficking protein particle complex subunit 2-like protein n=2 Tax=Paramecium TaxID=5884 RepID=A0A8S1X228_9CILI|nr:unnamed protein product [Paramecium primaurelia]CAD8194690.1 unnamed protein product [Paramecium pentaurelia]